ncbi:MAG TPA: hypothetical protein VMH38_00025 [Thermoplasmata archaeon]|nr:hypothetical protein [Thermoplasmata archaeon]
MRPPPNANPAVRRFAGVWAVSLAVKIAAVAVLLWFVLRFLGGS